MQKTKQTSPVKRRVGVIRRPWLVVLIILSATILTIVIFKLIQNSTNVSTDFSTNPVENSTNNSINTTNNSTNTSANISTNSTIPEKKVINYEGEDPNNSDSLTGTISYAGVSGNNYSIRVNINQFLSSGTCTLKFTGNGNTHEESANIISAASTSTCEGFDIPLKALGQGTYTIEITLSSGGKVGTITSEVTL